MSRLPKTTLPPDEFYRRNRDEHDRMEQLTISAIGGAFLLDGSMAMTGVGVGFKDEDDMASNSAVAICSQQSIKAYADTKLAAGATAVNSALLDGHNAAYFQVAGSYQTADATLTSLAAVAGVQGDLLYALSADAWGRLAGETGTTRKFLTSVGVAGVAQIPAWNTLVAADIPSISSGLTGILPVANGGTGLSTGLYGTDNQIPFINAAGTGFDYSANLTFDGTSLYCNGKLGILTASPSERIDIVENCASGDGVFVRIQETGATSPTGKMLVGVLKVAGGAYSLPGLWFFTDAPSFTNFGFMGDSANTIFNAPSGGSN
ncbi:MAG: hypothetical protein Q7T18_11885, partial [Sedimentisphaerales bacterium]|nr:hypothetical protein [Sedimentisphaerales bacterium]